MPKEKTLQGGVNFNCTNQGGQSHRCLRIHPWCGSSSPSSFSFFSERNPICWLLSSSCMCPITSLVAEKAGRGPGGIEGRTKAQKTN